MTERQRSAARTPDALAGVWERRTQLVKQELAAASAANDAKTARLRALRLERDRLEAAIVPVPKAAQAPKRKAVRRALTP